MSAPTETVPQSDDATGLAEIYPLHDTTNLTDEQSTQLADLTQAAMRPLVEAEWAIRGYDVAWKREPVLRLAADDDTNEDLRETEIAVWGKAYDSLDTDAIWAQMNR